MTPIAVVAKRTSKGCVRFSTRQLINVVLMFNMYPSGPQSFEEEATQGGHTHCKFGLHVVLVGYGIDH